MNENLINHPNVVVSERCVSYDEISAPLDINGHSFSEYAYIVMPLYEKDTLLTFLQKAYQR